MKYIGIKIFSAFVMFGVGASFVAHGASVTSCGQGYILADAGKVDGIPAVKCEKLWCRDLETGRDMGRGDRANNGYRMTAMPVELCDGNNRCVECWGERRWCGNETSGQWRPEYGIYMRDGADDLTYRSYLRGACFAWQLEKPNCADGQTAILVNGKWVCGVAAVTQDGSRASAVRRTGTMRRIRR